MKQNLRFKRELIRLLPMIAMAIALLFADSGAAVVIFAIGIIFALTGLSHYLRRTLFPYIDLKQFSDKALEDPKASATVFGSVCFVLAVIIYSAVSLLH